MIRVIHLHYSVAPHSYTFHLENVDLHFFHSSQQYPIGPLYQVLACIFNFPQGAWWIFEHILMLSEVLN